MSNGEKAGRVAQVFGVPFSLFTYYCSLYTYFYICVLSFGYVVSDIFYVCVSDGAERLPPL
jgi:hypothetical protein